jgi:hypothetical protein
VKRWISISDEKWRDVLVHAVRAAEVYGKQIDERDFRIRVDFAAWDSGALDTGQILPMTRRRELESFAEGARQWVKKIDEFRCAVAAFHQMDPAGSDFAAIPLVSELEAERKRALAIWHDNAAYARRADPDPPPAARVERDRWLARLVEAWAAAGLPVGNSKELRVFLAAALAAYGETLSARAARAYLDKCTDGKVTPVESITVDDMCALMGPI